MNDQHYITPLAAGILDVQPIDAAFNDWILAAADDDAQLARCRVALACVDLLAEHTAREVLAAEVTEARATVVGLFERRARRDGHPSVDDCSPWGIERAELAREEHDHDVAMGRYWDGA